MPPPATADKAAGRGKKLTRSSTYGFTYHFPHAALFPCMVGSHNPAPSVAHTVIILELPACALPASASETLLRHCHFVVLDSLETMAAGPT